MTRRKKQNNKQRNLAIENLAARVMLDAAGLVDPVFYGPTPYLQTGDTPAEFITVPGCDDCVYELETFEDNSLDHGLVLSTGNIIGPGFSTGIENLTDSVDGDDGIIDGTGQTNDGGYSYFTFENSITVTLPSLMQSAGVVWTDGAVDVTNVIFEAFDEDGDSLGVIDAGDIADDSFMGTTAEDSFFGVSYGDGVATGVSMFTITNVGGQGIEIDHIQYANCSDCCDIDLELTKSVNTAVVAAGDTVTWTIDVTNNPAEADADATGVQISDVLPAGLSLQSFVATDGTFDTGTGVWTLSDPLAPGENETLTLVTTVDAGLGGGTMITNVAQVSAANEPDVDSAPGNDSGNQSEDDEDSAKITIGSVIDLEVVKDVNAAIVNSGDNVTWTVSVSNNAANANAAATGVELTDVLPAGLSVVSVTPSGNGQFSGSTWSLIDPLAPGATETLTVVTTIDGGLAGGTMLTNTAFVSAVNETDVDSAPVDSNLAEDDADDAKVTIGSVIDLELSKTVDQSIVENGDQVTYTLMLTNNAATANTDATNVSVVDVLPDTFDLINATASGLSTWTQTGDVGEWSINEPLSPGETATVVLVYEIGGNYIDGTVLTNVAQVSAADQTDIDSQPSNDDGDQSQDDEANASITVNIPSPDLMLSGFSYVDTNDDGIFQNFELPLMGVQIDLTGTDDNGNAVNLTTFTNIDGFYKFNGLTSGNYTITQTQPVQFVDGRDTIGNLGGTVANDVLTVDLDANGVEYNFGELGLRAEFVNKRLYLTSTPYADWQYVDVRQSSIWYSFDVAHQSFIDANGAGGILTLFNADMEIIATGTDVLSALAEPGQYYLQVAGDSVLPAVLLDLTTPNVSQNGDTVTAIATAGDDNVELFLGDSTHVLSISGLEYEFDANVVDTFNIGAATGDDTVTVYGTDLDDNGDVIGTTGSLTSAAYEVHTYSFDNTTLVGGGGDDYGQVYGTLQDDVFSSLPGDSKLTTPDNVHHMLGFERVDAFSRGGNDYATLYGTLEDDTFIARDEYTLLRSSGSIDHVGYTKDFARVDTFGRGGNDYAQLHGTSGDDRFVSTDTYAMLIADGRLSYTNGFEMTDTYGGSGNDKAFFYNLKTNDVFGAIGFSAELDRIAEGREDRTQEFEEAYVNANAGETPTGNVAAIDLILNDDNANWI